MTAITLSRSAQAQLGRSSSPIDLKAWRLRRKALMQRDGRASDEVSVPLRGRGLKEYEEVAPYIEQNPGFSPLTGKRFERGLPLTTESSGTLQFGFSPLTGKRFERSCKPCVHWNWWNKVSVPLRGRGLKDLFVRIVVQQ